jgi:hypothetical protein
MKRRYLLIFIAALAGIAIGLARQIARNGHLGVADLIAVIFIVLVIIASDFFYRKNDNKDEA